MQIKMLKRVPLSGNGDTAYLPEIGQVVEVDEDVGDALVRGGDGQVVDASTKDAGPAPDNKDSGPAPSNKSRRGRK